MENNNIKLANIIAIKYNALHEGADSHFIGLICDIIEQVKYDCGGTEQIIDKTIKILDKVLGE